MAANSYKVWAWGSPVSKGVMDSYHVGIAGIAKKLNASQPFAVSNEIICGQLARGLCLPVPPGFLVENGGDYYHVSLNFNLAGHDLPPADSAAIARNHPQLACGIILFDSWIANHDRHEANLAYDTSSDRVQLFDHSHAFMAGTGGLSYLQTLNGNLCIGNHCLASQIQSLAGMQYWFERINQLPEYYIEDSLEQASKVGLPASDIGPCLAFLLDRRAQLIDIVRRNQTLFPNVQPTLWSTL